MMHTVLWIAAVLLVFAGMVGIVVPVLPGTILVFAGLLTAAWADGFVRVGWGVIALLGLLTVLSLAVDAVASWAGVRRTGASRQAVAGAFIGAVIGLFFGIVGILFLPFIGAVAGELMAHRDLQQAGKAGFGTVVGFLLGAAVKIALAFAMIALFAAAYFF